MINLVKTINNLVVQALVTSDYALLLDTDETAGFTLVYKDTSEGNDVLYAVKVDGNEDPERVIQGILSGQDTRDQVSPEDIRSLVSRGPILLKSENLSYLFVHPHPDTNEVPKLAIESPKSICMISMSDKTVEDVTGFVRDDIRDCLDFD